MLSLDLSTLYAMDRGWTQRLLQIVSEPRDMFEPALFPYLDPFRPEEWSSNPISDILDNPQAMAYIKANLQGVSATSFFRAQVICQQAMWHLNWQKGPEGDGQPKTLRKLWYAGHKEAAQRISMAFEVWRQEQQMDDVAANGALSQIYSDLVDTRLATYLHLFVKDGSRQFEIVDDYRCLPAPLSNCIMAIEKDAAYEDCVRIGKALGVRAAMSGGGKMGRAGTERMIREGLSEYFDTQSPGDRVTWDNPLYLLVISDYDYDGEQVIAPTFKNQLERYVDPELIHWVRVGILPEQLPRMGYDMLSKAYRVRFQVNSAYTTWCKNKAVFDLNGRPEVGLPAYFGNGDLNHNRLKELFETYPPLGFELDALKRVEYADLVVEGFLSLVGWDNYLEVLSRRAMPELDTVVETVLDHTLARNQDYQALQQHLGEIEQRVRELTADLEAKRNQFQEAAREEIRPLVEDYAGDRRIFQRDRTPQETDMIHHLQELDTYQFFQPFNTWRRQDAWSDVVESEERPTLDEIAERPIQFTRLDL